MKQEQESEDFQMLIWTDSSNIMCEELKQSHKNM